MTVNPRVGQEGGQTYDIERSIRGIVQRIAEGRPDAVPVVARELLQNADDARATEVAFILDERVPPTGLPSEYRTLYRPAMFVRNNAPFRTSWEVGEEEVDDFTALLDVANGHKSAESVAAGKFGIGFNSVYMLTDNPVLFSRREIHILDVMNHIFKRKGWKFGLHEFLAEGSPDAGPVRNALDWMFPKKALGEPYSFSDFAMVPDRDFRQSILRIPLRQSDPDTKRLFDATFDEPERRISVLDRMSADVARSSIFLKNIRRITFSILDREGVLKSRSSIEISDSSPALGDFITKIEEASKPAVEFRSRIFCEFDRSIQWASPAGTPQLWKFRVKHTARFDDATLEALRKRLTANSERATPWVAIAIPLDRASMQFERHCLGSNAESPNWRVFLPLDERGPSGCVFHAALFVGGSRKDIDWVTDGSDALKRKTEWNSELIEKGLVPLLRESSLQMLEILPSEIIDDHPAEYIALFPAARPADGSPSSLAEHFQQCFNRREWTLCVPDLWGSRVEVRLGTSGTALQLETVPERLARYREEFQFLSGENRRFIRTSLRTALSSRTAGDVGLSLRGWQPDVARAILQGMKSPQPEDLKVLLEPLLVGAGEFDPATIAGLWAFQMAGGTEELIRFDPGDLYLTVGEGDDTDEFEKLSRIGLSFHRIHRVSPRFGLSAVDMSKRGKLLNVRQSDRTSVLDVLRRVHPKYGHNYFTEVHDLVPLVDFLCGRDSFHLTKDLKLAFLVRTARSQDAKMGTGLIGLKPRNSTQEDEDAWEIFFRPAFPEMEKAFADQVSRLLSHAPHLETCLGVPGRQVRILRSLDALGLLLDASQRDPTLAGRLDAQLNRIQSQGKDFQDQIDRAMELLFDQAIRQWESLNEESRLVFLALPVHRRSDGRYGVLLSPDQDPTLVRERFRLQSVEDVSDARELFPNQNEDYELLKSEDRIKRFYRLKLEIPELGHGEVLAQALREVGTRRENSENGKLLLYLGRNFNHKIQALESSRHDYERLTGQELRRLLGLARIVPCVGSEWARIDDAVDVRDLAKRLTEQWPGGYNIERLASLLFPNEKILLLTDDSLARACLSLQELRRHDAHSIADRALTSESAELDLVTRIKLLRDNWNDRPHRSRVSLAVGEFEVSSAAGARKLKDCETVTPDLERSHSMVVGLLVPHRIQRPEFSKRFSVPREQLDEVLDLLGVPLIDEDKLKLRLVERFSQVWSGLREDDARFALLRLVDEWNLTESLSARVVDLDVVRVDGKVPWVKPGRVVAPRLLYSKPPSLSLDQIPVIKGDRNRGMKAWDRWCGIRDHENLLLELHRNLHSYSVDEACREPAKLFAGWVAQVLTVLTTGREAFLAKLKTLKWVLAEREGIYQFRPPESVHVDQGRELLRHEFWVAPDALPGSLTKEGSGLRFATIPKNGEYLGKLVRCLEKADGIDPQSAVPLYEMVDRILTKEPALRRDWDWCARTSMLFWLFRKADRRVSSRQIFLGDAERCQDIGSYLLCLQSEEQIPQKVISLYGELGIPASPTLDQVLYALSILDTAHPQVRQDHQRLVTLLRDLGNGPGLEPVTLKGCRVRTLKGDYARLDACFRDEELGRPGEIAPAAEHLVIDETDEATLEFCDWALERFPDQVRYLRQHCEFQHHEPLVVDDPLPEVLQALGIWRDWLLELASPDSCLRAEALQLGLEPPADPLQLVLVTRVGVRYTDGRNIIELGPTGEGPMIFRDGHRLLIQQRTVSKSLENPRSLDESIASRLTNILICDRAPSLEDRNRVNQFVLEKLDRPISLLKRMRKKSNHFLHQYQDQKADSKFAHLYDDWCRTRPGSSRHRELRDKLWSIFEKENIEHRRQVIREHGYDSFSVFAELLQNAEDAYLQRRDLGMPSPVARSARFSVFSSNGNLLLRLEHFGRPFNYWRHGSREVPGFKRDVERILGSSGSFKGQVPSEEVARKPIGRFGLGFKSVYLVSDAPRIHSGHWHFEIEAACRPKEIPRPPELHLDATRIDLPLRPEFKVPDKSELRKWFGLLPFLREVDSLELPLGDSSAALTLTVRSTPISTGSSELVDLVKIETDSPVPGRRIEFLRVRHADHPAQLALCLGKDGLPTPWDGVFERDLYVGLPLRTHLGVGVGVSHHLEVQSGRTHLVEHEDHRKRYEEIAGLVQAIPAALQARTAGLPPGEVWSCFWRLWSWDRGDQETSPLREALARQVAQLASTHAIVPSSRLAGVPCRIGDKVVSFFSGVPQEIEEILVARNATVSTGSGSLRLLSDLHIAPATFAEAYRAACQFGRIRSPASLHRLNWESIGEGFKISGTIARDPELLNQVAEKLDESHRQHLVPWLKGSHLACSGDHPEKSEALPGMVFRPEFEGSEHLPSRLMRFLSPAYSEKAISLLLDSGLKERPSARDLENWIQYGGLSQLEAVGVLTYLEGEDRFRGFWELQSRMGTAWIPDGKNRLTPVQAAAGFLAKASDRWTPVFRSWLGIHSPKSQNEGESRLPETPGPSRDPVRILNEIAAWWQKEGADRTRGYEARTYPQGRPPELSDQFDEGDCSDRKQWMTLLILGGCHTMGRTRAPQHRGFLEKCEHRRWLDTFAEPRIDAAAWLGVLEDYLNEQVDTSPYYHWMVQHFVRIFHFARWLPEYVGAFRQLNSSRHRFDLKEILDTRSSAKFQGGGFEAPPLSSNLGHGACFVVRELFRRGILDSPLARPHAYVPSKRVLRLFREGLGALDRFDTGEPRLHYSTGIHQFLVEHLGEEGATFQGAFDLPFWIITEDTNLQLRFLKKSLTDIPVGSFR